MSQESDAEEVRSLEELSVRLAEGRDITPEEIEAEAEEMEIVPPDEATVVDE